MNNSLVLNEALSIPEKIDYFNQNDKNDYKQITKKIKEKKIKYIVTVARGTSDCAALFASYVFAKTLGLTTYSLAPSLITLEKSSFNFENTLVIIISQSGLSQDLIECEKAARQMGGETLILTNNYNSPMINTANNFFYINAGEEKSIAATKSFVLTVVVIVKLIAFIKSNEKLLNNLISLPEFLIQDRLQEWNYEIVNSAISSGFIISRGVGVALSAEMSLKFKELCQEQIEPFSSAEVMHGPKSLIQNSFKLYTLVLNDLSGASINSDTRKIKKNTNLLYEISSKKDDNKFFYFSKNNSLELEPIVVMAKFYPWIIKYTIAKGLNPDNPRYLTKVTQTL